MQNGFIKVPRAIERYSEFGDFDVLAAYLKLRFLARFREGFIDGVLVRENQLLISKPALADSLRFTVHKVRRILNLFEKMGGIRCENIKNKYTLITLLPPFTGEISGEEEKKENPSPVYEETDDEDVIYENSCNDATDSTAEPEQSNASSEKTDNKRGPLKAYGKFENVMLTEQEYEEFKLEHGNADIIIEKYSASLVNYTGEKISNHYAKLCSRALYDKDERALAASSENSYYSHYLRNGQGYYSISPERERELEAIQEKLGRNVPKLKKRDKR